MKKFMVILIGAFLCRSFDVAESSMDSTGIRTWLTSELEDEATASQLTDILSNDILRWKSLPKISISEVQAIVAYAFGNRLLNNSTANVILSGLTEGVDLTG